MNTETFEIKTEKTRNFLRERLLSVGIPDEVIDNIISSGYYLMHPNDNALRDSFYQNSLYSLSTKYLKEVIFNKTKTFGLRNTQIIEVKSITDAYTKIKQFTSKINPNLSNRWAFRGENCIWTLERKFPNPWMCDSNGNEISLIPSHWREFRNNYLKRFSHRSTYSIFQTIYADEIIYDGIKDWKNLSTKNYKKYGIHTMSDLEDFPEPENQEYYKKWFAHKINLFNASDLYYLEQHYGFKTACLDITFDLPTAIFFALNSYVEIDKQKKIATYKPINDVTKSVVYVFIFTSNVMTSDDIIRKFDVFSHLTPLRPLRQNCQQFGTDMFRINDPATFVTLQIRFSSDFDFEGVPAYNYLIHLRKKINSMLNFLK